MVKLTLVISVLGAIGKCLGELRLLQSVFRHGDRYPLPYDVTRIFYPLNTQANTSWYPDSAGGLTIEGKRRSYEFGDVMRERYGEWLGPLYSGKKVRFRSTGNERTTMTASLVAAGIFPPDNSSQRWNPFLNWQPIPISPPNPYPDNTMHLGGMLCTKFLARLAETRHNDPKIVEYDESMQKLYDYVTPHVGVPGSNRILFYLHMEFHAMESVGQTLPDWAQEIYYNGTLEKAAIMEYEFSSWTDELKRVTGGQWLKEWFANVDKYLAQVGDEKSRDPKGNDVKTKAIFYACHDINIAGILTTLGLFSSNPHVPFYTSVVNLELHENDDKQYFVKVNHRNTGEFIEYKIPGCDDILCPLETFRNLFKNVMSFNVTEDCGPYFIDGI